MLSGELVAEGLVAPELEILHWSGMISYYNVLDERLKWAFQKLNKPSINSNNSFYLDVVRFIEAASAAGESNRALIELANRRLFAGNMSTPLKKLLSAGLAKESHPNLNILKQDKVRHTLMASALSVEFIMQEQ